MDDDIVHVATHELNIAGIHHYHAVVLCVIQISLFVTAVG